MNLQECQTKVKILEQALKQNYNIQKQLEQANEELVRLKKQIEEQQAVMIEQQKLASMGEMIGNIAHQWRQPLNALGLVLQNIKKAYERDRLDDAYLEKAVTKGKMLTQKMSSTIDDFRNLLKAEKIREHFNINNTIEEVLNMTQMSLKNHNIEVEQNININSEIYAYPNELFQVVINLINNSKDAYIEQEKSGKIIINTKEDDREFIISVEDEAGGIPFDDVTKVFEPYFTTKDSGTGIGLYMSKMIIMKDFNGQLNVENTEKGAKFTVILPKEKNEQ